MSKFLLDDFISEENFEKHVKELIDKYNKRKSSIIDDFNKNIIDPIKFTFSIKLENTTFEQAINNEINRQLDKSLSNSIGKFHQYIFKYIKNDNITCECPKTGFDIICIDKKTNKRTYVEMKNKWNTMNASSAENLYHSMLKKLEEEPDAKCFLVEIITKKSQNIIWEQSLKSTGTKGSNPNIKRVSIDRFYEFVTGKKDAFKRLCEQLPYTIDKIIKKSTTSSLINTSKIFKELNFICAEELKALFLKTFKDYLEFDDLTKFNFIE